MTQLVTPELERWIIDQAQAGCAPDAVRQAMLDAGWSEAVAMQAMEETLSRWLASQSPRLLAAAVPKAAVPGWVGMPCLQAPVGAGRLDLGDRVVDILVTMQHPVLAVLGGFLSEAECDALVAAAQPRLNRSLTVHNSSGGEEVNPDRTSQGMFFQRGETDLVQRIEQRIARLLGWPVENGEGLQVLHYRPGAEYKPHYDYFDPSEPGTPRITVRGGQRVATLVIYLNDTAQGGATVFPDVGLDVLPRKGHAVFFAYEQASPTSRTLHGGAPVLAGDKWVATKWLRQREF